MSPWSEESLARHAAVRALAGKFGVPTTTRLWLERMTNFSVNLAVCNEFWEALVLAGLLPPDLRPDDVVWAPSWRSTGPVQPAALAAHWPAVARAAATLGDLVAACAAWDSTGRSALAPSPHPSLPGLLDVGIDASPLSHGAYDAGPSAVRYLLGGAATSAWAALFASGERFPLLQRHAAARGAGPRASEAEWQAREVAWSVEVFDRAREVGVPVPESPGRARGAGGFRRMPNPTVILRDWITSGLMLRVLPGGRLVVQMAELC